MTQASDEHDDELLFRNIVLILGLPGGRSWLLGCILNTEISGSRSSALR